MLQLKNGRKLSASNIVMNKMDFISKKPHYNDSEGFLVFVLFANLGTRSDASCKFAHAHSDNIVKGRHTRYYKIILPPNW